MELSRSLIFSVIVAALVLTVQSQQYVPIQVLFPVNSSYPLYQNYSGYSNSQYNISNFNSSTGYKFNQTYPKYNSTYPGFKPNYTNPGYNYSYPGYNSNATKNNFFNQYYANQFPGHNVTLPTTYNETYDGHLFQGLIQRYDRLLFNQTYRREAKWFGYNDVSVKYPTGGYNGFEIISAIRVYNRFLDGTSCTARVVTGGVGYQYVKIKLSSSWRRGFLYNVQIFGH
ncbi:uncharacterized protein LOC115880597 isoform X1 [Sitophilus oryzae]|uniref:Uncharacterized protein LOC115880597 isoform X1 n=1 Tax=Sitophilus oryzae TaxID=7048 RepID=A0A6J2XRR2_SITOR|nr:uncharacterized protein LOC115880597 isoform X1 [Sitophilus oryzae]